MKEYYFDKEQLIIVAGCLVILVMVSFFGGYYTAAYKYSENKNPAPVVTITQIDKAAVQALFNQDLSNAELVDELVRRYPELKTTLAPFTENTVTNRQHIAEAVGVFN